MMPGESGPGVIDQWIQFAFELLEERIGTLLAYYFAEPEKERHQRENGNDHAEVNGAGLLNAIEGLRGQTDGDHDGKRAVPPSNCFVCVLVRVEQLLPNGRVLQLLKFGLDRVQSHPSDAGSSLTSEVRLP